MTKNQTMISGAGGWIGGAIIRSGILAKPMELSSFPTAKRASDQTLIADLSRDDAVDRLVSQYHIKHKADTFIHCAGFAHQPFETDSVKKAMWSVNDIGTASALAFCQRIGIKRFVYISTIAAYDWSTGFAVDEDSKQSLLSEYAKSKIAGEARVLAAPIDGRIVRLATVFGNGDRANFERLANALSKRRFPIPGAGFARKSVIPIDTAARLIAKFAMMEQIPHKTINIALPNAPQLGEICDAFSQLCDLPRAPRIPLIAMKALAKAGDYIGRIRKTSFNSDVLQKLTTSTWVDTARMQETFPDEDLEDFTTGLTRHASYYRSL